jgi:hypothetical protein
MGVPQRIFRGTLTDPGANVKSWRESRRHDEAVEDAHMVVGSRRNAVGSDRSPVSQDLEFAKHEALFHCTLNLVFTEAFAGLRLRQVP